jgi:hypothetical protein
VSLFVGMDSSPGGDPDLRCSAGRGAGHIASGKRCTTLV